MGEGLEQRLGPRRGSCSFYFFFPPQRQAHMTEPNTGKLFVFSFQGNFTIDFIKFQMHTEILILAS